MARIPPRTATCVNAKPRAQPKLSMGIFANVNGPMYILFLVGFGGGSSLHFLAEKTENTEKASSLFQGPLSQYNYKDEDFTHSGCCSTAVHFICMFYIFI